MTTKPNDKRRYPCPHHRPDPDALTAITAGTHGKPTLLLGDDQ
jgi:hypothetical protein